ncbi:sigma factor [Fictibacillus sp. B-59209]|uniref:RNA polymerase sigma factor n=1 Tax=Fictibacillus sp. B-59209 TaxID=3024873 RepID=UPI002E1BE16B|nr:sigma factor [Fictibacillus sp. B-59209]
MSKLTDFELYLKVQNGDKSALEQIYDRYEKLLFSFAYRMTQRQDTAKDVVQEVFIKLWRKKGVYSEENLQQKAHSLKALLSFFLSCNMQGKKPIKKNIKRQIL